MAAWYAAPPYAGFTPLMPSQQSSLRGTRTAFVFHDLIACADARSVGPSKIPHPSEPGVPLWMHLNSWPERSTPMSRMGVLLASTSWLPTTRSESPDGGAPEEELLLELAVAPLLVLVVVDVLVLVPVLEPVPLDPVPDELLEDAAPPAPEPLLVVVDEPLEDVVPPVPEEVVLVPEELLVLVLVDVVVPEELLLVLV